MKTQIKRIFNYIEAKNSAAYLKKHYPRTVVDITNIVKSTNMGYENLKIPMWKNADLVRILERYNPSYICEFGSGTTTAIFNAWIDIDPDLRKAITFESHPTWYEILLANIKFSKNYIYILSSIDKLGSAASFHEKPTIFEPDFVYIDAPPIEGQIEYNSDFIWIINNYSLPKVFVVDVRYKTVAEMYKIFRQRNSNFKLYVSREFPVDLLGENANYQVGNDIRHSIFELN